AHQVLIPATPPRERVLVDLKHGADMRQGDASSADHAGNRADTVAHAPALIAGVVAHRRVRQTTVSGDCSQAGDKGDEREIERGKTAALKQLDENILYI